MSEEVGDEQIRSGGEFQGISRSTGWVLAGLIAAGLQVAAAVPALTMAYIHDQNEKISQQKDQLNLSTALMSGKIHAELEGMRNISLQELTSKDIATLNVNDTSAVLLKNEQGQPICHIQVSNEFLKTASAAAKANPQHRMPQTAEELAALCHMNVEELKSKIHLSDKDSAALRQFAEETSKGPYNQVASVRHENVTINSEIQRS